MIDTGFKPANTGTLSQPPRFTRPHETWEFWHSFFAERNLELLVSLPGSNLQTIFNTSDRLDSDTGSLNIAAGRDLFKRLRGGLISGGAHGSLTPLLALWRLGQGDCLSRANFLPSFELYDPHARRTVLECDGLATIATGYNGAREIVLIEGKSGWRIKDKDLQRLTDLQALIGIPCFKCIANLRSCFRDSDLNRLARRYRADPKWIILSQSELEPEELLGVSSLAELSMATIQRYLRPTHLQNLLCDPYGG